MEKNWFSMNSKLQMGGCGDEKKGKQHAYLTSVLCYFKCFCNISIHYLTPVNNNLQGTCMPSPSPKFTGFPVTTILQKLTLALRK